MHWEKEIRIRITIRRLFIAILAASTVTNLAIVGAIVEAESSPPAPTATLVLTMTSSPTPLDTVPATAAEAFTATFAPTMVERPTDTVAPPPTSVVSTEPAFWMMCIKRYYWPTYRVQAGDRLSALALATGSTSPELMAANCLKSDQIYAGQLLYLPRPVRNTPTATQTPTNSPTPTDTPTSTDTSTPTSTVTPTDSPTPTSTYTSTPTDSPTPTDTPTPTPTVLTTACDRAELISETVPPGTVMPPAQSFSKTWVLMNVGACTWTSEYSFIIVGGELLGMPEKNQVPYNVHTGETLKISFDLTSPDTTGIHRGDWKFISPSGAWFGIGPNADQPWSVVIDVAEPTPTPTPEFVFGQILEKLLNPRS